MRWKRRTVDSMGVRLAVRDSGSEGVPVVLVHGLVHDQETFWATDRETLCEH
jgi:hypothetical protein